MHHCRVCLSCASGGALLQALATLEGYAVTGIDCMSGCTRPATVAFRAAGKTAYLFGEIGPGDMPDLKAFARAYTASADGNFADARILGALRMKAIARIPG